MLSMKMIDPFKRHPADEWWKFKVGDLFPHDDALARYILMLLTANEDLSNVERLRVLLETEKPDPGTDEIAQAKWNRGQFFLARLRLGFLHNAWKEIIEGDKEGSSFEALISGLGKEVVASYKDLRDTVSSCRRTKNILRGFRNRASFHYDQRQFEEALKIGAEDTGKIIVGDSDTHFIVAYQALDLIPAGRPPREEVINIKEEVELIQGKFHKFVMEIFLAYLRSRSAMEKITITSPPPYLPG